MEDSRIVVWFSCGAASAVAAKLALEKYGTRACVVYCDTMKSEHPDNVRFFDDVQRICLVALNAQLIETARHPAKPLPSFGIRPDTRTSAQPASMLTRTTRGQRQRGSKLNNYFPGESSGSYLKVG